MCLGGQSSLSHNCLTCLLLSGIIACMDSLNTIYQLVLVQPVYNALVAIYATLGQQSSGLTFILVGLVSGLAFMPAAIRNYFDQEQVKALQPEIEAIKSQTTDPNQRQQQILKFLKSKNIHFQSESIFLFGQAIVLGLLYPILIDHWKVIQPSLLYSFTSLPDNFSANFLNITTNQSSPTLSLIPAVLLFLELRQSYKEQQFLTSFVDRWYPVILPLFTYFLIFWLPSGLSITLAVALGVSLYFKTMLQLFTLWRRPKKQPAI
jgi:membrane protein insertase Oxa1/YidC/SpoIIIJ